VELNADCFSSRIYLEFDEESDEDVELESVLNLRPNAFGDDGTLLYNLYGNVLSQSAFGWKKLSDILKKLADCIRYRC
ncbi:hypothetical protein BpHYR1_049634, partial [Brachionus plicatilis]